MCGSGQACISQACVTLGTGGGGGGDAGGAAGGTAGAAGGEAGGTSGGGTAGGGTAGGSAGGGVAPVTLTFAVQGTGHGVMSWKLGSTMGTCPGQCSATVPSGTTLHATALQDEQSGLTGFGAGCGSDPLVCDVTYVTASRTVTVTFQAQPGSPTAHSVSTLQATGASPPSTALAGDGDGGVLLAGKVSGMLTLGGTTLSNTGYLASLASGTSVRWVEKVPPLRGSMDVVDVATGGDHIVIGGACSSGAGFVDAGTALANGPCVARLTTAGDVEWARSWAASGQVSRVAVSATGQVAVAGTVSGALNLGTGALSDRGGGDFFFGLLDADGGTVLARRGGKSYGDEPGGVAFAPNGDVLFSAQIYGGPASFETIQLTQANFQTASFIARYSPAGVFLNGKGLSGQVLASDLLVDGAGAVYFVGEFANTVDFGGISRSAGAGLTSHGFAVKYDTAWAAQWVADGYGIPGRGAVAADGSVALAGSISRYADWGGGYLVSDDGSSGFLVKVSASGAVLWSKRLSSGYASGLAFSRDRVWVSGRGRVAVGPTTATPVSYLIDYLW
ncbi:MAG: hypothetical protein IPJ65_09850 [Archangiaceae bacterium]|nr:hypothetical protein [Archangiaceae bacterium]